MADHSPSAAQSTAQDRDLTTCCHRHHILATAADADADADADPNRPVPVTLYHWSPPTVRTSFTTLLPPDVLRVIKGFTSLGTFFVANDFDPSKDLPELLTATETPPTAEPTAQLLTDLISQLPVPEQEQGHPMRFFSFPLFSDSPTDLFGEGLRPVFKWAKPDGVYRKAGFWEAELHTAVEDGEWNGGTGLVLLVRGVEEEVLRVLGGGEGRFTSLERVRRMIGEGVVGGG